MNDGVASQHTVDHSYIGAVSLSGGIENLGHFFEFVIIKLIFAKPELSERLVTSVSPTMFDIPLNRSIMEKIIGFYESTTQLPTTMDVQLTFDANEYAWFYGLMQNEITQYNERTVLSMTEEFIKQKRMFDIVSKITAEATRGKIDKLNEMPDVMRDALTFSFDMKIGTDVLDDPDQFYDEYHKPTKIIPSGIPSFDQKIGGGFPVETLSLFLAETNLGKSLIMCSIATSMLLQNKNVLYVSAEMSEMKVRERVYANMFDIELNAMMGVSKEGFRTFFNKYRSQIDGRFIVKAESPRTMNANGLRRLLAELKTKKKFVPDVIFFDYLGVAIPNELRRSDNTNSELKRVSEEFRAIAVDNKIPMISAVQVNRDGFGDLEIDLTNMAESIAVAGTADIIIGVTQSEELRNTNCYRWQILKNRYGKNKEAQIVGVDYDHMRLVDRVRTEVVNHQINPNSPYNNQLPPQNDTIDYVKQMMQTEQVVQVQNEQVFMWE